MKVYLHLYSHDYCHLTNLTGEELIGDVKKFFAQRFNSKNEHGVHVNANELTFKNKSLKVLYNDDLVSKTLQDGDDLFVSVKGSRDSDQVLLKDFDAIVGAKKSSTDRYTNPLYQGQKVKKSDDRVVELEAVDPQKAQEFKERGNALMSKKDYHGAIEMYTQAIEYDATQSVFYSNRAQAFLALEKYDETIDDCDECIALDSNAFKAYYRKGCALMQLNVFSRALEVLEQGMKVKSIDASFLKEFKKKIDSCKSEIQKTPAPSQPTASKPSTPQSPSLTATPPSEKSVTLSKKSDGSWALGQEARNYIEGAIQIAEKAEEQRNYRHAITCYENIIQLVPDDANALAKLSRHYFGGRQYAKSLEFASLGFKAHNSCEFAKLMGQCYMKLQEFENATNCYRTASQLAVDNKEATMLRVRLGEAMYAKGDQSVAVKIWQNIIAEDDEHFDALFAYGKAIIDHATLADSIPVFLKLLVKDPNHLPTKEVLADLVQQENGMPELLRILGTIPKAASGFVYIANAVKEYGAVKEAVQLYEEACSFEPSTIAFHLSLVHNYEVLNDLEKGFQHIKKFCKNNPNMSVGQRSNAHIYNAIRRRKSVFSQQDDDDAQALPCIETQAFPLDVMYNNETLDLLAFWCTLTKVVYLAGTLDLLPDIASVVQPVREGRPIHTTNVRNEHAYHCCIIQLLDYHPKLETLPQMRQRPKIYVSGDSHALVPAWQPITVKGVDYRIEPLLVTGCKCWHLRDESKFFPKVNFWNVVTTAPRGSHVIFGFGEIDCREGFVISVQKCIYKDIEEGCGVAIDIYIKALLEVQRQKEYHIYIQPAAPVIDVTRDIVRTFNSILKKKILAHPTFKYLDIEDDWLSEDKTKLNTKFDLDGTHMNPLYLYAVERELNKCFVS